MLLAQFLTLAVLAFPVLQTFAKRKEATRAAAVFAPLAPVLVFFVTLSQGLSASVAVLWVCAFFVFLCNIPQFVRFVGGLTFDSTAASYAAAVFQLLLLTAAAVFCFLFRPVAPPERFAAGEERLVFTRAPSGAFYEKKHFSEPENMVLTLYYPAVVTEDTPLTLYLPDIYASSADCAATAAVLAGSGFIVVLADFNPAAAFSFPAATVRPFLYRMQDYFLLKRFTRREAEYVEEKKRELEQFYALTAASDSPAVFQNRKPYLLAEGNIKSLAENLKERYPENIADVYFINTARRPIDGYVNGGGNLAVFHPFEAFLRDIRRDEGWNQARAIAQAIREEWHESK